MIDIEGIFDEEMEVINNIDNFNFDIPLVALLIKMTEKKRF